PLLAAGAIHASTTPPLAHAEEPRRRAPRLQAGAHPSAGGRGGASKASPREVAPCYTAPRSGPQGWDDDATVATTSTAPRARRRPPRQRGPPRRGPGDGPPRDHGARPPPAPVVPAERPPAPP